MNVLPVHRKLEASEVAPELLAGNKQLTEEQKIGEAARQFEAVLLRQILESGQKTVIKSSLTEDSTANSIYRDVITNQLADSISKSGTLGLARTLKSEFMRRIQASACDDSNSAQPGQPASILHQHGSRQNALTAPSHSPSPRLRSPKDAYAAHHS